MHARPLSIALILLLVVGLGLAQNRGAWNVESEFDLYSYGGLGSIWLRAFQHPDDMAPADALLVVGCDASSPNGFEVAAWVAPLGTVVLEGDDALEDTEVEMLVRFDQGAISRQTWFLAAGFYQVESVAYYDRNEELFDGLSSATVLALRLQADARRGIIERTFQFEVGGFAAALEELRCGDASDSDDGAMGPDGDDAFTTTVGDWAFEGADGMVARSDLGAIGVYCAADANGIEIEVGDYALTAPAYDVRFRSGNVEFLRATASLNDFSAAQLDTDDLEDRLVRFLRGVVDLTITVTPTDGSTPPLIYTVPTLGFNDAIAELGCYLVETR